MVKTINLIIDDQPVSVPAGTLVVDAAKRIGNDIPVFCYHPKMEPVGMCRMCLVEIGRPVIDRATGQPQMNEDGTPKIQFGPKLDTACTTPVSEGMVVRTNSEKVISARREVLEFLLTSHPLDCPICDKGGECPLQNLTMAHGPGKSRFLLDDKIRLAKHYPLGELIFLDRERCIQCARCIRFQNDIAGDPVLGFSQRGRGLEIITYSDPGFDSYFSGNTTDICPVGALTSSDFRFAARPWELKPAASICTQCPVGCNITLDVRREVISSGKKVIKRVMPRQNEEVNEIWICDKGRWGYHFAESQDRIVDPLVRRNGELVPASWDEALDLVASRLRETGAGLVTLVGGRLPNEDLFNLRKLAEAQAGQTVLYSYMDGGDHTARLGLPPGSNIGQMGPETAIVVVASNLLDEAPIWYLRVRAAAKRGAKLIVINPRATRLDEVASGVVHYAFGDEAAVIRALGQTLAAAGMQEAPGGGMPEAPEQGAGTGAPSHATEAAVTPPDTAATHAATPLQSVVSTTAQGAETGGGAGERPEGATPLLTAALKDTAQAIAGSENLVIFFGSEGLGLAGSRALADACAGLLLESGRVGRPNNGLVGVWPAANLQGAFDMGFAPAADLEGVLSGAGAVLIAAADPAGDDPRLAAALQSAGFRVVQEFFLTETARMADVILPAQTFVEREGTFTSGERRVQRFYPAVSPFRGPRPDFRIAADIAQRLGHAIEGRAASLVFDCLTAEVPDYREATYLKISQVREQWPIVHRGDLYYGGASYGNAQGLGFQLPPGGGGGARAQTERQGEAPTMPALRDGEVLAVPVTSLYDRGNTLRPSSVLQGRVARPEARLHPRTAGRLGLAENDTVVLGDWHTPVMVKLDAAAPEGVALVTRSTGVPISGPRAVALHRVEAAVQAAADNQAVADD